MRILLLDEPDAHLHPDLQVRFADFIVNVCDSFDLQVLVATHSASLMSAIGQFADVHASIVYFDRTKAEFKAQSFSKAMKELSACLGGHALMGSLFGFPL